VNTTAEVKAESDYCCTSGNAVEVVNAIPADQEILFLPDMFLGAHVRRLTGRKNIHVWMGECHVHAGIDPENIRLQRALHPEAEFLIHPECGCATSVVEAVSAGDVDPEGVHILSTEGMIKRPGESGSSTFIVATEVGILHRLRKAYPEKAFHAANERASCAYMKVTTLPRCSPRWRTCSIASPCPRTWPGAPVARSSAWWRSAAARRRCHPPEWIRASDGHARADPAAADHAARDPDLHRGRLGLPAHGRRRGDARARGARRGSCLRRHHDDLHRREHAALSRTPRRPFGGHRSPAFRSRSPPFGCSSRTWRSGSTQRMAHTSRAARRCCT
jgi:hypothetical protein